MAGVIAKYHCNYCQEDITGIRVKCAECPDFDLCLQCFSCAAEIGAHKNSHSYQLIDCGNFPVFNSPCNWKAKEELILLEAVEQYGFGNWEDVSRCLGNRKPEEVQDHFNTYFISGNIGRATWSLDTPPRIKDHTTSDVGPLSPCLNSPVPPLEVPLQEQQELGYMPNRDDYEREYDNEAESLVCNLSVHPEDDDIDIALKLAHIDMYSRRLHERLRRKKIAREFNLVSQFFSCSTKQKAPNKRKQSKEDKDLEERFKVFCQFQTSADNEQFFDRFERAKELKSRIKELMRYRRNGITKLNECSEFETARYKREKKKENKKKSFAFHPGLCRLRSQKVVNGIKKTRRKRKRLYFSRRPRR